MKSGNRGVVTSGSAIVLGAQAATVASTPNRSTEARRRMKKILLRLRPQPERCEQAARDISNNRHLAVARLVDQHAGMPIQPRNPLPVAGILGIEGGGHTPNVELDPRGDRIE